MTKPHAPQTAPYGTWSSPLSAKRLAESSVRLREVRTDAEAVYWLEGRPLEGGRGVVVRRAPDGTKEDVTPAPYNVRTLVHEYGGGSFTIAAGTVYFSNFSDGRLYRVSRGAAPSPLSPVSRWRYADMIVDEARGVVVAVGEDHAPSGEPRNCLVRLRADSESAPEAIAVGHDFFSSVRLSHDGRQLAWLTWDHPRMPWEGTELWVGDWNGASLSHVRKVAGGPDESIFQPEWSPEGSLWFVSDRSGWWNLYRARPGRESAVPESLWPKNAEFGRPQWVFGMATYAVLSDDECIASYSEGGLWHLGQLDLRRRAWTPLAPDLTEIDSVRASGGNVFFLGASSTQSPAVVKVPVGGGEVTILHRSSELEIDESFLSRAEPFEFPTENGLTAHGLFYRPRNRDFVAPPDERPPLIVMSHGGPTGSTSSALDLGIQFWTSRGFAVLDVNYGGSTGYGKAYRQRLEGNWGVVDVDDCANGARALAGRAAVDGRRMAIRGGSAGGYTTLSALTFRNVFQAGASHYGVSDIEALATDTHKFESRYMISLVGPYPEKRALYRERSPIHAVERICCPVILLQGLEDKVVPPNQSEKIFKALKAKGIPVAYVAFPGEQHGFRKSENIVRALESELAFYARVFGFRPADALPPLVIENLASPHY